MEKWIDTLWRPLDFICVRVVCLHFKSIKNDNCPSFMCVHIELLCACVQSVFLFVKYVRHHVLCVCEPAQNSIIAYAPHITRKRREVQSISSMLLQHLWKSLLLCHRIALHCVWLRTVCGRDPLSEHMTKRAVRDVFYRYILRICSSFHPNVFFFLFAFWFAVGVCHIYFYILSIFHFNVEERFNVCVRISKSVVSYIFFSGCCCCYRWFSLFVLFFFVPLFEQASIKCASKH